VDIWRKLLQRKRFSIDQVVGEVSEIEVLCDTRSLLLAYDPEHIYSVEKGRQECYLRVFGEKGTTFRLVEHLQDA
jgi:hypothetical protein